MSPRPGRYKKYENQRNIFERKYWGIVGTTCETDYSEGIGAPCESSYSGDIWAIKYTKYTNSHLQPIL